MFCHSFIDSMKLHIELRSQLQADTPSELAKPAEPTPEAADPTSEVLATARSVGATPSATAGTPATQLPSVKKVTDDTMQHSSEAPTTCLESTVTATIPAVAQQVAFASIFHTRCTHTIQSSWRFYSRPIVNLEQQTVPCSYLKMSQHYLPPCTSLCALGSFYPPPLPPIPPQ